MRLTPTGLGIGSTTPRALLDIGGSSAFTAGTYQSPKLAVSNGYISIKSDPADGVSRLTLVGDSSTGDGIIDWGGNINANLKFANNGSEKARIDGSGRLLVGTSTSGGRVGATVQIAASASSPSGYLIEQRYAADNSSGADLFLTKSRGSIASPAIVNSGDNISIVRFSGFDGANYLSAAEISAAIDATPGTNDMPGRLVFSTTADGASSPTERMRITNTGQVFVATTTEYPGDGNTATGFMLQNVGKLFASCGGGDQAGRFNKNGDGTLISMSRSGTTVGSISVTTTATAYNTSSDYRLKENVVPLTGAADRVKQLKPNQFNFIADPSKTVDGFIAHEAQAVVPEAVTGTHDEVDADGNPVYQGIDQSKLVPLLTAALQEALAKIEALEQRLSDAGIA
jgi:hypothetical protein